MSIRNYHVRNSYISDTSLYSSLTTKRRKMSPLIDSLDGPSKSNRVAEVLPTSCESFCDDLEVISLKQAASHR